jgi:prepilin-type N-terminal cleavage/methylation domain-containing protein
MKSKGFTLIELAVVLAIIAVLAAILTPVVINYLDQARVTRAMADASTIAQAVQLYRRDTGYYPSYASLAHAQAGTTDYGTLVGAGNVPTATGTGWSGNLTGGTVGNIVTVLNTNIGLTANVENPGKTSFRGPYIGALDTDPWGNAYVVGNLVPTAGNLGGGHAFVVSAGPDGILQTNASQTGASATAAGDDIIVQVN